MNDDDDSVGLMLPLDVLTVSEGRRENKQVTTTSRSRSAESTKTSENEQTQRVSTSQPDTPVSLKAEDHITIIPPIDRRVTRCSEEINSISLPPLDDSSWTDLFANLWRQQTIQLLSLS